MIFMGKVHSSRGEGGVMAAGVLLGGLLPLARAVILGIHVVLSMGLKLCLTIQSSKYNWIKQ